MSLAVPDISTTQSICLGFVETMGTVWILSAVEAGSGKNGCSAEGNWLFTTGCEEGITRKVVSTEKSVGCSDESECSE